MVVKNHLHSSSDVQRFVSGTSLYLSLSLDLNFCDRDRIRNPALLGSLSLHERFRNLDFQ
jgi:hypothetical protein